MTNNIPGERLLLVFWLAMYAPFCLAASRFDGTWQGTYNSLHYDHPQEPGAPLEQTNEFELRLHERKGIVTGEFTGRTPVTSGAALGLPREGSRLLILNGKIFDDRACFDVVNEYGDMRWCVTVRGNKLSGTWSGGPEGGPILGGAGAGARFYEISGRKVAR